MAMLLSDSKGEIIGQKFMLMVRVLAYIFIRLFEQKLKGNFSQVINFCHFVFSLLYLILLPFLITLSAVP